MNEFTRDSLKDHGKGILKMFYCHILAVCLGWAAYPLLILIGARYMTIDVPMSIYSIFATIIYILLLLAQSNDLGVKDRRPYKWAKYRGKGFVLGALAGVMVVLLQYVVIAVANEAFIVQHPQFDIGSINSYIRMILYVPLFWLYSLFKDGGVIIPPVTHLTALIIIPFISLFAGLGYWMGLSGITLNLGIHLKRKK